MASSYRLELNKWLSQLDVKAGAVLDIGGSQENVKGRTKSWDVQEYLIADLPQPHRGNKPDIEIDLNLPMRISDEMTNGAQSTRFFRAGNKCYEVESFDLIFCLEVFEYVHNPLQAFTNIKNCLSEGGTAYISFPSFYPLHEPVEDDCLRYMPAGIKKLAEASGLKIVNMIPRRPETSALQQFFSAERLRAAKNQDHTFLGWIVEMTK